ncbi:MAG: LuxR C-terminal-related transcriptional regulator [Rhizomicrobium sp.]
MALAVNAGRNIAAAGDGPGEQMAGVGNTGLFDYIQRIQEIDEIDDILLALQDRLVQFGISYFVFASAVRNTEDFKRGIIAARLHPQWAKRFFAQQDADENPLLSGTLCNSEPLFWHEIKIKPQTVSSTAAAHLIRIYRDARSFGLSNGLCVPVYYPGRGLILAHFVGTRIIPTSATRVSVHAMALYTCNRLMRLSERDQPKTSLLTAREADCLAWAAQGKTDWEIGEILGISENTVHWYIENIKRKLGVSTRIQAVVSAIQDGAIQV